MGLLQEKRECLPQANFLAAAFLSLISSFEQKNRPEGDHRICVPSLFPAPGGSAGEPGTVLLPKNRLIAVHNLYPITEACLPEPDVGRLADAAFGCKDVSAAIHADCCAVQQKSVMLHELTHKASVQANEFCGVMAAWAACQFRLDFRL